MKRIQHIAVYLPDGGATDPALENAVALARRARARLTLLSAMPINWESHNGRLLRQLHANRLAGLADGLDLECDTAVLDGPPVPALRQAVSEREIDLLVKTARPYSFLDRVVGGVARRLLRCCPCPVWVVRESPATSDAPVIAAVGSVGWGAEPEDIDLAKRVIALSATLAAVQKRPLLVAHAFNPIAERVIARTGTIPHRRYLYEEAHYRRADLRQLIDAVGVDADIELVRGEPANAITDLALRRESDTIVMGNHGRSGIAGWFIGNTAERAIDAGTTGVVNVVAA